MCMPDPDIKEPEAPRQIEEPKTPEPPADASKRKLALGKRRGTLGLRVDMNRPSTSKTNMNNPGA